MALFRQNFEKPGRGVSKDEPEKNAFLNFWELYFRRFFDLCKANMLFAIPTAICLVLLTLVQIYVPLGTYSFLSNYILVLIFPFVGGLTYICRCYVRREHAFIFSDFMDAVKKNWKQFLANGFICISLYIILYVAISYYQSMIQTNWIFSIPFAICVILAILSIFAEIYIPVMIITFDMKLRQIYKNAYIFAIMGLWRNILTILVFGIIWFISEFISYWVLIHFLLSIIVSFFFLFAFFGFLITSVAYPFIDQFMIRPAQEEEKKILPVQEEKEEDEPTFRDSLY